MSADGRVLQALLRSDFRAFVQKVFLTLTPGQTFIHSWHLDAIADRLEQVRLGKVKRLIINMPPRSLKSIMTSVAFPAFTHGLDPTRRIINVSYSGDLTKKHSNDYRAVIESPWFRSTFPGTRVGPFKNSETEIELTKRGFRLATSVGGTLTGRGGDIIIVDDPLKPDDAFSETKRSTANQWYKNTLLSRLDDKRKGAIIVVMQRLHMDDMTGFLTAQSDDWEILNLSAIAECDETISCWKGKPYFRKAGEVLSPEREPLETLEKLKLEIGSDGFSAQYQQMPVPPGGAMIKRSWINRYNSLPPASERLMILQSWDTANKGGPQNDWSVCTTWHVFRGKRWYLVDVLRDRYDYPALKSIVERNAKTHNASRVLVEDAGSGSLLLQELKARVSGIIGVRPEGDKVSRMAGASAKFEARQVFLPERAFWLADFESELFSFPVGRHDDQCDSVSQALLDKNIPWMRWLTDADWVALHAGAGRLKHWRHYRQ